MAKAASACGVVENANDEVFFSLTERNGDGKYKQLCTTLHTAKLGRKACKCWERVGSKSRRARAHAEVWRRGIGSCAVLGGMGRKY